MASELACGTESAVLFLWNKVAIPCRQDVTLYPSQRESYSALSSASKSMKTAQPLLSMVLTMQWYQYGSRFKTGPTILHFSRSKVFSQSFVLAFEMMMS
jgi:hypothetical protein